MTARWKDIMGPGSFKGLQFPIVRIGYSGGHALAINSYPDVGGQDVEDQGRNAEQWTVEALFSADLADKWGDDIYPGAARGFKRRLQEKGSGELVLPVWGSTTAAVLTWTADEDAGKADQIAYTVTFVEDSLGEFALKDSTSLSKQGDATKKAQQIDTYLATYEGAGIGNPFADLLLAFTMVLFAVNSTRYTVESAYLHVRASIQGLIEQYATFTDPAHWDLMELTISFNSDIVEMVSGTERNFPLFRQTVTGGEIDLFTLSKDLYGTSDRWEELFSLNAAVVQNPMRVPPGTTITYQV